MSRRFHKFRWCRRDLSVPKIVGPFEAKFPSECASCNGEIQMGDKIYWLPGPNKIAWHADCKVPRSLSMYVREQSKAKE